MKYILPFKKISKKDIRLVGGKNASLGEMMKHLSKKINIPDGFALTARAYRLYRKKGDLPEDLKKEIKQAYKHLSRKYGERFTDIAVRSSGTSEDLPTASFAGQFDTFLNVRGEEELFKAIKKCMDSLFNKRAIAYAKEKGIEHSKISLSVGVQKMVRSDIGSAGVMFTLDTESGFPNVVLIHSVFGTGEKIVQGKITPDEFYVFKPTLRQAQGYRPIIVKNLSPAQKRFSLNDEEVLTLARWAKLIEKHYGTPQDIEWAKDGKDGKLYIVQSRPETVHALKKTKFYQEYELKTKKKPILTGIAIGDKIGQGKVKVIPNVSEISQFQKGEVLVTKMTDPDWTSIMGMASAIITDEGGKTCHSAIISRELGIPCIVGTQKATKTLKTGQMVTVDCSQGLNGRIYQGKVPFEIKRYDLKKIPRLKTKIMINIGAPEIAFKTSFLPNEGVGLAREEFIIAEKIRVHPLALYHFNKLKNKKLKRKIAQITKEHKDKKEYFIKELAEGIGQIAAAFWPKEVIVRFSDFKSNEYRNLIGGELFEKEEANPMLGFRGASRYLDKDFQPAFQMELKAIQRVRNVFGLKNVQVMIPFCRTVEEGEKVRKLIKEKDLKVYVMCEIPSNVILAQDFLKIFDGMSIGSNDLTQLVLGVDRDNAKIAYLGDERNKAVKEMVVQVIKTCYKKKKYCGICGDAPSSLPEFAQFLIKEKIPSLSLSPDAVIKTILNLSKLK